jgi:hypothetical protein
MKNELRRLADEIWKVVLDTRASRIEKLEAAKVICACKGVLIPEVNEEWLSAKQIVQLRRLKHELVQKALKRKEMKKRKNRRAYLRRQIRTLEAQEGDNGSAAAN